MLRPPPQLTVSAWAEQHRILGSRASSEPGPWRTSRTPYLRDVMDAALPLQPEGWMILTRRLAVFFISLAVANELIWRFGSTEAWVFFKTFGDTLALLAFFASQYPLMVKYSTEEADQPKP